MVEVNTVTGAEEQDPVIEAGVREPAYSAPEKQILLIIEDQNREESDIECALEDRLRKG